jgi:hypothetical protein
MILDMDGLIWCVVCLGQLSRMNNGMLHLNNATYLYIVFYLFRP